MKEVKQYKCEYCGTLYADKSECAACEKQHTTPEEMRDYELMPANVVQQPIEMEG